MVESKILWRLSKSG